MQPPLPKTGAQKISTKKANQRKHGRDRTRGGRRCRKPFSL